MEDASAWHHAIVGQQPQEPLGPLLLFFRGFDCGDALGDTGPELRGRLFEERSIAGSFYGSGRPAEDIPILVDQYRAGRLKLDELLTRRYPLEQINEAYAALDRGEVARSVIVFEDRSERQDAKTPRAEARGRAG